MAGDTLTKSYTSPLTTTFQKSNTAYSSNSLEAEATQ